MNIYKQLTPSDPALFGPFLTRLGGGQAFSWNPGGSDFLKNGANFKFY